MDVAPPQLNGTPPTLDSLSGHGTVLINMAKFGTIGNLYALARSCRGFWYEGRNEGRQGLLWEAMSKLMKKQMDATLHATKPKGHWRNLCFDVPTLFPRGAELDQQGQPQVLISGSAMLQTGLGVSSRLKPNRF